MLVNAQNQTDKSLQNHELIASLMKLSFQKLCDTADYYLNASSYDTAMICYTLLVNTPVKKNTIEQQKRMGEIYNKRSVIYYYMCDYSNSFECLIKALKFCEKSSYDDYLSKIYTNLGNIYYHFSKPEAKWYYQKALNYPQDSTSIAVLLNNLGAVELEMENLDSAAYFLNKSLKINKKQSKLLPNIWNNMASFYQKKQLYDSALYYFHLSLDFARKNNHIPIEIENLTELGKLFFEMNNKDSALFYIKSSNIIAKENNLLRILADNYLIMSEIEEGKGNIKKALEYYKMYANMKDSIFNTENLVDMNQLRRLYESSQTNQQIEQLVIDKHIKDRTIHFQKMIWIVTLCVLLFVTFVLLIMIIQKKRLDKAYQALVEKNVEIMDIHKKYPEKQQKMALANDMQEDLIEKIVNIMEDTAIICDPAFTIDKLATMTQSNHTYVSQVINTTFKKNFRSFLNSYRIREAQLLFSSPNAAKYTIEAVSLHVGFKSRSAFRDAFKEITGVSPVFYLRSIQGGDYELSGLQTSFSPYSII